MPTDPELDSRLAAIHEHLAATQQLPVERGASRWIGEAEAVADDLVDAQVDHAVIRTRLGHVRDLLANVDDTENEVADGHVADARRLTDEVLAKVEAEES